MDLFEQYEQDTASSSGFFTGRSLIPEMTTAGLVNAKFEEEQPIFTKQKTNLSAGENITHMAISNNQLALSTKTKIKRCDLNSNDGFRDSNFTKSPTDKSKVYEMFGDRTGSHLLLSIVHSESLAHLENLYLYHKSSTPQIASKSKGHIISSVAWNNQNAIESSTGCILLGTTRGLIFETEFQHNDSRSIFQPTPEMYWKLVFDMSVHLNDAVIISGLFWDKINQESSIILVATPSHIYQFIGSNGTVDPPILFNVFSNYRSLPEKSLKLPGTMPSSKLTVRFSTIAGNCNTFACMTESDVVWGQLNYSKKNVTEKSIIENDKNLPYLGEKSKYKYPLSVVLTEFHVLVLFRDKLKVLNVLDGQLVFEDIFTELYGSLLGIVRDPNMNTILAYSEMAIYRYKVVKEDRNIWEVYLKQGEYELAKKYCKKEIIKLEKVLSKQAEDFFQKRMYEKSAEIYAQTHSSFEEKALKFLEVRQEEALKVFLKKKLAGLKPNDKIQITMTIFWLLELFLNQLGVLRNSGRKHLDAYKILQDEFHQFLKVPRVKDCISDNRSAVYKLMTSHGDEENLIYFTILMNDYERVIQYHLQQKDYDSALDFLTKQNKIQLFYQFSPTLMQAKPKETVNAWIEQNRRLNPVKLIPALVQYEHPSDPNMVNEAIRYLEWCVYPMKINEQAIHNYLLALYAQQAHGTKNSENLMTYLKLHGQDLLSVPYDQKFALRFCSELGLDEACVHIYTTMELYEEAVDLALKFDIELAEQNANRPEDDEELKKKLWLKIAKHVVKEENDIKRAMQFLQKCNLIKIEDVLPFFPDFVTIDHFKDAICSSLQEYNQHIESLKEEMEDATQSAQEIRSEIQTFRNRYNVVKAQQKCSSCSYPIMTRSFYLFPCRHMFHSDCIIVEILPHLTPTSRNRVEEIQRQLLAFSGREDSTSVSSLSIMNAAMSSKDKLCAELDDLVAAECILCGDLMIRNIDEPFIPIEDYPQILESWK